MGDGPAIPGNRQIQVVEIGRRVGLLFGGGDASPHAQNVGGQASCVGAENGIVEWIAVCVWPFGQNQFTPFDAAKFGLRLEEK